ncbi:MAG: hypothetical protein IJ343_04830 [Clostridia bacterium]|nr:hypothetical protein [Clostridia bacterium]
MKKFWICLLTICLLLPVFALAETAAAPEGHLEDFADFTMSVSRNGMIWRYNKEKDDGLVAEIVYVDVESPSFQPYLLIHWFPNNMSAYLKGVHPLNYAKQLWKDIENTYKEADMVLSGSKVVYGQKKGDTFYCLSTCHVDENSWYCEEPHDLWVYQRFYGTYDMGTYYFEIYAPTRAHVDAIVKDLDTVEYK